jgi:hypothetical protein
MDYTDILHYIKIRKPVYPCDAGKYSAGKCQTAARSFIEEAYAKA